MKLIILLALTLMIFLAGCVKSGVEPTPEVSPEESEIDNSLNDLEELDELDSELELDFDEMEGYLK